MPSGAAADIQDPARVGGAMTREQPLDEIGFALIVLGAIERVVHIRVVTAEHRAHARHVLTAAHTRSISPSDSDSPDGRYSPRRLMRSVTG